MFEKSSCLLCNALPSQMSFQYLSSIVSIKQISGLLAKMANQATDSAERLFKQNTVNSLVRRNTNRKTFPDSLDLILSSVYNHETDLFVDKFHTKLQLDNAKYNPIRETMIQDMNEIRRKYIHHPLVIGKWFHLNLNRKTD